MIDGLAMGPSGALMLPGVVGLGIVEVLAGPPYGTAPATNDAGQVVATPMIEPALWTGLVLPGLVILLLWGIYRTASPEGDRRTDRRAVTADRASRQNRPSFSGRVDSTNTTHARPARPTSLASTSPNAPRVAYTTVR